MKQHKMGYFLAALGLTIILFPFVGQFQSGAFIEAVLMTVILLSAVHAVGDSRVSYGDTYGIQPFMFKKAPL